MHIIFFCVKLIRKINFSCCSVSIQTLRSWIEPSSSVTGRFLQLIMKNKLFPVGSCCPSATCLSSAVPNWCRRPFYHRLDPFLRNKFSSWSSSQLFHKEKSDEKTEMLIVPNTYNLLSCVQVTEAGNLLSMVDEAFGLP